MPVERNWFFLINSSTSNKISKVDKTLLYISPGGMPDYETQFVDQGVTGKISSGLIPSRHGSQAVVETQEHAVLTRFML